MIPKNDHRNGKYCAKCKTVKPLDDFGLNKYKGDGHESYCKDCRKIVNSEYYYRKNKGRIEKQKVARPCASCGKPITGRRKYCSVECRCDHHYETQTKPARQGITVNALITARMVRKEDHLDHPKTAHVCHWYAPAYRCICGKRQAAALTATGTAGD